VTNYNTRNLMLV